MSHYSHLTLEERYQISALLGSSISITQIARQLNRHRSTIHREIQRNKGRRGYRPKQANDFSVARKADNQLRLTDFFWRYVDHYLSLYFSPEQIVGRLKHLGWSDVGSIESIYLYIYRDKQKTGNLHKFLRCQKTYRKRGFEMRDRRGKIPNRKDISERPVIIDERGRIGDWEGDTVIGHAHRGVLLTYAERVTRLSKIRGLPNRKADLVAQASIDLLKQLDVATITYDNGKEFTHHDHVAETLGADIYFARPYHSWERGTNENMNGLIRQFFGKDRPLDNIDPDEIQKVENLLNNRPRKVLGYLTPFEAYAKNSFVALHN